MEIPVQPDQKEKIILPENYRFVEGMLSDESIQGRRKWLLGELSGEGDVNVYHAKRFLDRAETQQEAAHKAWEQDSDVDRYRELTGKSKQTEEMARRIFGENAVAEVHNYEKALYDLEKSGGDRIVFWGDIAQKIFDGINENSAEVDDRADAGTGRSPNPVDSKEDRNGFRQFLQEKRFIDYGTLQRSVATERNLCLRSDNDNPFEIPVSNIVSAGSFDGWAGRDNGTGNKAYSKDGQHVIGRSLDVIIDYATRNTPLPPLEGAVAFVQPNGLTIFATPNSNHRASAAIARGDKFVKVKGEIQVFILKRNFVEGPAAQEQVREDKNVFDPEHAEDTDWNDVFELTRSLNLPDNAEERAVELAGMSATDLIIMTTLLHSRLASNADQNPTQHSMNILSPDGSKRREMIKPENRFSLYEHASSLIKKLASKITSETVNEFLERVANIVALTTVITHSFEDGNGRTARYLAHLIKTGAPSSDADKEDFMLLGANRPLTDTRIIAYIPRIQANMTPQEYLDSLSATDIPLGQEESYKERTKKLFTSPYV